MMDDDDETSAIDYPKSTLYECIYFKPHAVHFIFLLTGFFFSILLYFISGCFLQHRIIKEKTKMSSEYSLFLKTTLANIKSSFCVPPILNVIVL